MKTYTYELFCDYCNKDTKHKIQDSEHERDGSNDFLRV